jgi:hypothetical protein
LIRGNKWPVCLPLTVPAPFLSPFGKGYIGSGNDTSNNLSSNDFWEWDPNTNTWTQKANVPGLERRAATSFVINGIPFAGCGWNGSSYFTDMYRYDGPSNIWTAIASFEGAGAYTSIGFSIGQEGYIGSGGTSGGASMQFWEYKSGLVGIDVMGSVASVTPILQMDHILLNGWSIQQADRFTLTDVTGRKILDGTLNSDAIVLPSSMSEGVYLLQLTKENKSQLTWRFVKSN